MDNNMSSLKYQKVITCLFFLFWIFIYTVFRNNNPSNDAWAYAASAKWGFELFSPHHLLYNLPGFILTHVLQYLGFSPDVLILMQTLNAIAAGACLWMFYRLLQQEGFVLKQVVTALTAIGSSYVFLRYATENETYIFPLFCMLSALFYWNQYIRYQNLIYLIASGSLMGSGILFHQQQIISLIALTLYIFIYRKLSLRSFMYLILPVIIITGLGYISVWAFTDTFTASPLHYFFHDFIQGSASFTPGWKQWILTPVSLIRTGFQLHGNILPIVNENRVLIIGLIISILFVWMAVVLLIKNRHLLRMPIQKLKLPVYLFIGHLVFALWFGANHEFMVPLPVLGAWSLLSFTWTMPSGIVRLFVLGMLIWNISIAMYPQAFMTLSSEQACVEQIQKTPGTVWVLQEANAIRHRLFYDTGVKAENLLQGPAWYYAVKGSTEELHKHIDSLLLLGVPVYTDCLNRPQVWSRANWLNAEYEIFASTYTLEPVMIFEVLGMEFPVYRLLPLRVSAERSFIDN